MIAESRSRIVGLIAAVGVCGCDDGQAVPLPDLTHAEGPVKAKVLKLRAAVLETPSTETWGRYARTLDAHGMYQEAEQAYLVAADLAGGQKAFDDLHLAGLAAFDLHPERAREHFRRALALRGTSMATHLHLARLEESLDNLEVARTHYARVAQAGASSHALLGLGRIALRVGDAESALVHLNKASAVDPEHRQVYEALARAYARLGREKESREAAEKAGNLAKLRYFGDPLQAQVEAECVHAAARFDRGSAFARAKRYPEAIVEFRAGLEGRPDDLWARYDLARLLELVGKKDEARAELDRVLAKDPEHKAAREMRARLN